MTNRSALTWDGLSLHEHDSRARDDWWLQVEAEGTGWGNPEAVVTEIRSQLQDGSLAVKTADDNRTATARVRVCSRTFSGLDRGEMALKAKERIVGLTALAWTVDREFSPVSVFDVVYASLDFEFDDVGETRDAIKHRVFGITFECLPYVRAEKLVHTVLVTDQTTPAATTTLSDGSTDLGWSTSGFGNGGGIVQTDAENGYYYAITAPDEAAPELQWRGDIDVTTTRYIVLDYQVVYGFGNITPYSLQSASGNVYTVPMTLISVTDAPRLGFSRAVFQVNTTVLDDMLGVGFIFNGTDGQISNQIRIDNLARTNRAFTAPTGRIKLGALEVSGSARTPVLLALRSTDATALWAWSYLYTSAGVDAVQPSLRTLASVAGDVDNSTLSGAQNQNQMQGTFPSRRLTPATYNLIAHVCTAAPGVKTFTVTVAAAGGVVTDARTDIVSTFTAFVGPTWHPVDLGLFSMPVAPVTSDSTASTVVTVQAAGVLFDDVFCFDDDHGTLTVFETNGLTRAELRPPDGANPERSYWIGKAAGGAPAALQRGDFLATGGLHRLEPGPNRVFLASSKPATVEGDYFPRFHSHVYDPAFD